MIESVGLDFDNTALEVTYVRSRKIQEAARRMGKPVPSLESILENYDDQITMVEKLFPGVNFKQFDGIYRSVPGSYPLVDGVDAALRSLHNSDIKLWIYSSRPRKDLEKRSCESGLPLHIFSPILTEEDTHPYDKHDSRAFECLKETLARHRINYRNSLFVDDDIRNYNAARSADFAAVLFVNGPASRGYENVPENDLMLSMQQLPELVKERNRIKVTVQTQ